MGIYQQDEGILKRYLVAAQYYLSVHQQLARISISNITMKLTFLLLLSITVFAIGFSAPTEKDTIVEEVLTEIEKALKREKSTVQEEASIVSNDPFGYEEELEEESLEALGQEWLNKTRKFLRNAYRSQDKRIRNRNHHVPRVPKNEAETERDLNLKAQLLWNDQQAKIAPVESRFTDREREVALQSFLRKIAPYILSKLRG